MSDYSIQKVSTFASCLVKVRMPSSVRLFSWVMYWVSRDLVISVRVVVPWILTMHERPEQD